MLRTWLVCIIMAACALIGASCAATAPENPLALAETAEATTQMAQATYNAATQVVADVAANLPAPTLTNFNNRKRLIVVTPTAVVIVQNGQQIVVFRPQASVNPTK
jgi:hypothetical protein